MAQLERILNTRVVRGRKQYLVKWQGACKRRGALTYLLFVCAPGVCGA